MLLWFRTLKTPGWTRGSPIIPLLLPPWGQKQEMSAGVRLLIRAPMGSCVWRSITKHLQVCATLLVLSVCMDSLVLLPELRLCFSFKSRLFSLYCLRFIFPSSLSSTYSLADTRHSAGGGTFTIYSLLQLFDNKISLTQSLFLKGNSLSPPQERSTHCCGWGGGYFGSCKDMFSKRDGEGKCEAAPTAGRKPQLTS